VTPSRWTDRLLGVAFTILVVAVMLDVAARLIVAVLPVLIGVGAVVIVLFLSWSAYQFWRSRW
jgi:hypothetical protein